MGKTPERGNPIYWGRDIPWISISDMNNQKVIKTTKEGISTQAFKSIFKEQISPAGTLIMSFKLTVGRTSILGVDALHNEAIISIFPKKEPDTQSKYLFYILPVIANMGETKDAIKGRTLNSRSIYNLFIPVPPIEEQKRIVEKLEVLLAEIDKLEEDEKALKELEDKFPKKLKNAILQSAVEGKLTSIQKSDVCSLNFLEQINKTRFELISKKEFKKEKEMSNIQSSEFLFDIPTNWNWIKLGDIASINTGVTFKKEEQSTNGIRILRGGNISNGEISIYDNDIFLPEEKVKAEHFVKKFDILTPSVTSIEHIGKVGIVNENANKIAHGGFVFKIRLYLENYIFSKYIYYYIQSPKNIDKLRSLTNKSGQAFYNLGKEKFRNILIPIPPINEQKQIVEELDKLFAIDIFDI